MILNENLFENKLIKSKLERTNNYVLNAIVNHALYNVQNHTNKIKKNNFVIDDVISEIAIFAYNQDFLPLKDKPIRLFKKKLLSNFLNKKYNKPKLLKALENLDYNRSQAEKLFEEMFDNSLEK